jgi:hypothetical protein
MTDGIIQKVFNKRIEELERVEPEKTKWLHIRDTYKLQQELIKEIKICMVSLYEQHPLFQSNALKIIQKELIGDNE